jgi:hypothetical protein
MWIIISKQISILPTGSHETGRLPIYLLLSIKFWEVSSKNNVALVALRNLLNLVLGFSRRMSQIGYMKIKFILW